MEQINLINEANFNKVYNMYLPQMQAFINNKIHNNEATCEICNDAFLNAYKNMSNFRPELSGLRTWLFNLAKNVMIDFIRKNKNHSGNTDLAKVDFFVSSNNNTDNLLLSNEVNNKIEKAFSNLNSKQKEIADLFFIQDMKMSDIAEALDIPLNTVKVTILRARKVLQESLKSQKVFS